MKHHSTTATAVLVAVCVVSAALTYLGLAFWKDRTKECDAPPEE